MHTETAGEGILTAPSIEQIRAVSDLQEYIARHIGDEITLSALARRAGYSPWHTAKLFRELTGKSPFEYIRALRLSKAALTLRDKTAKVVDVALDFLFDSHEGFTRAFKRQFGVTPVDYRKQGMAVQLYYPYPILDYYEFRSRAENAEIQPAEVFSTEIVRFPARKMILRRGVCATDYFEYVNELDCDVWGVLISIREALYEPVGLWLPDALRPEGTSLYAQGVEVPADYRNTVPEGFDVIDLPACDMLVFQGEPFEERDFDRAITAMMRAIDAYDPEPSGYRWADERAPRVQPEPQGYRGYIEARPVVKL